MDRFKWMKEEAGILIDHPERCTILFVQNAVRKLRSRSSRMVKGPSTAGIVTRRIDQNGIK